MSKTECHSITENSKPEFISKFIFVIVFKVSNSLADYHILIKKTVAHFFSFNPVKGRDIEDVGILKYPEHKIITNW